MKERGILVAALIPLLPERRAELQDDLEHGARGQALERAAFGVQRRRKPDRPDGCRGRLQNSKRQGHDGSACLRTKGLRQEPALHLDGPRTPAHIGDRRLQLKLTVLAVERARQRAEHRAVAAGRPKLWRIQHPSRAPLFSDGACAHARCVGGVETLDEGAGEPPRIVRYSRVREKALEAQIVLPERGGLIVECLLDLAEQLLLTLLQPAVEQGPVSPGCVERGLAGFAQQFESRSDAAVNELRPELDGSRQSGLVPGPDSPTDAVACVDEQYRVTGGR